MTRPIRYLQDTFNIVEDTVRVIHGRLLLRPSEELNEIVNGVIGRALEMFPMMRLYNIEVTSNHIHLVLGTPDARCLSRFMCYVNGNLAKEVGKLHGWRQKIWGRRFRCIPILDDESLLARMRYLLSHGCKENLVARPGDWPGVNSVKALTEGKKLVGYWFDRTKEYAARRRGEEFGKYDYATRYEVELSPLPCLEDRSEEERRELYRAMVSEIEEEARERRESTRLRPLGRRKVLRMNPHSRPRTSKSSPAPWCHASSIRARKAFYRAYQAFYEAYRSASKRLRSGELDVEFPPGCFPPALAFNARAGPGP